MKNQVLYRVEKADGHTLKGRVRNLRTNDGVNWQASHMGSGAIAAIKNIAITENSTAPSSTDTNLLGELAANGLSRQTGTFSHTDNQSLYTMNASWQYTGSSTVTVAKAALAHDATDTDASTDTHFVITALSPVAVLDSNDTLTIDWGIDV